MEKNAVLMPEKLSEFILALSVVTQKASDSDASITMIVPDWLESLSRLLSWIRIIPYSSNRKEELSGFDKIYLLSDTFTSTWNCFLAGIPVRRGMASQLGNPFLTDVVSGVFDKHNHVLKQYAAILDVPYSEPHKWHGSALSVKANPEYDGVMVFCPGPADNPAKQWSGFKELVKLVPKQEIIILGDKDDFGLAKAIAPRLPHRVKNLTGQTTLDEAASIMAAASVVIANDSGLMQLAGFLGVPVVGIFGSTTASWSRPLGQSVAVTSSHLPCVPCFKKKCSSKETPCLSMISADTVLNLANEICC